MPFLKISVTTPSNRSEESKVNFGAVRVSLWSDLVVDMRTPIPDL